MRNIFSTLDFSQQHLPSSHRLLALALGLCVSFSASADTTTLTFANTTRGSSITPVAMPFPIARSGDLSYQTILNYHTIDGTAHAGTDFTAGSGVLALPASAANGALPITLSANIGNGSDLSFQLQVDGATGIGLAVTAAAQTAFTTGNNPASVIVADINGDGLADLIVANSGSNSVSVLLNTTAPGATTPTFSAQHAFATGSSPDAVAVADINGDGKPDLIVANNASNNLSVLLNTTANGATIPTFSAQQTFSAGTGPSSVTVADINGDGKPDLIVANYGDGTVSVLRNTTATSATTSSFAAQQTFVTGLSAQAVSAADVNGDGRADLIVANYSDNTVSVLLNTTTPGAASTPSFAAQHTFATGSHPYSVTTTDVNGDGKLDLVIANFSSQNISVLLNTTTPGATTPSFAAGQTFATGSNPDFVSAADVNGDGKPDLLVANLLGNTLSVLLNTTVPGATAPSFATQQSFATGTSPQSIAIVDINGDGKPDFITANYNSSSVSVILNTATLGTATAGFATQQTFPTGSQTVFVTSADFNGDGKTDLLEVNYGVNTVSVLLNNTAAGASIPSFAARQSVTSGSSPYAAAAADLNGDGKPDLIIANYGDNDVSVLFNTTATGATTLTFASPQTFATGNFTQSIAIADLNGDGKPDLIVQSATDGNISVLLNTTATGAATPTFAVRQNFAVGSIAFFVAAADVNGDGKPDLIVANDGSNNVSVLLNTSSAGILSFAAQQTFGVGGNPKSVAITDLNGDGKPDIIVANNSDNSLSLLRNTSTPGTLSFAAAQTFAAATNSGALFVSVTSADVNGDGKPDLILTDYIGKKVLRLLNTTAPGATTLSFAAAQSFVVGTSPAWVTAADVNGDGKPDLIVANRGDSTLSVLLNTQYQVAIAGSPTTGTIVHDYIFANGFE
ncbi:FG-GAP-like repeat-containing protein [Pseudolysobacter antarcticus]|nr:FG-GAP-like repeat-containing protein [Pseudolysobacter antarcticus]